MLALMLLRYYRKLDADRLEVFKLLTSSVMPLGILTIVVLVVILFGITTATESASAGALGAFLLAIHARTLDWKRTKEAVFLTAKTTAVVCWLFVGLALFSGVFAILEHVRGPPARLVHTGQGKVHRDGHGPRRLRDIAQEFRRLAGPVHACCGHPRAPIQFMILSQAIIFLLGWPLEWTEIIVIFRADLPAPPQALQHRPRAWGTLVFVNLQAALLSPPVAMSAFYLKGVAPKHVTLNKIFGGMMPYMLVIILCMVIMYLWPGLTLWLPNYFYGR
ncbi:MAG: TRAP transporter large permease subunit [Hyphomicrobiaceae bacterium]|nr:TRAP transporter large permease subunit [Hyphomicrobiaceae bacterium]